jgi:hypothetical protein
VVDTVDVAGWLVINGIKSAVQRKRRRGVGVRLAWESDARRDVEPPHPHCRAQGRSPTAVCETTRRPTDTNPHGAA